jgi:hypothetical protein
LLLNQGKYAAAEPLIRRAIEISEKALGKDQPAVANEYTRTYECRALEVKADITVDGPNVRF